MKLRPQSSLPKRFLHPSATIKRPSNAFLPQVRIVDVLTQGLCSVMTEGGKLVEGVREEQLETVIPRGEPPLHVMLLRGWEKGQPALVLSKVSETRLRR